MPIRKTHCAAAHNFFKKKSVSVCVNNGLNCLITITTFPLFYKKKESKKRYINHISVYENIVSVSLDEIIFHSCSKIGRNYLEKKR